MPVTSEEASEIVRKLREHAGRLSLAWMRDVCNAAIDRMHDTKAPGASSGNHHDYDYGLLEHTLEVVEIALQIARAERLHSRISEDTLVVAAILHDIAKVYEYELIPGTALWRKSEYRKLHRHVAGGVVWLERWLAARGTSVDSGWLLRIEHAMLAHHGRLEWGSPVEPRTLEAQILHYADMLSAHPASIED